MKESSAEADFKAFEYAGWADPEVARNYDSWWVRLTSQSTEHLLDAAGVSQGTALLDVATGSGLVAAAGAARGARAVGLDFSPAMVEIASRLNPGIEFREGSAEALPFDDNSFDAVVISYGLLHFAGPDAAISEGFRVLRPGGRLAFTVWATPEHAKAFGIVLAAVQKHGNPDVPVPPGPPFFRFSYHEECRRTLLAAGFVQPQVRNIPQLWRLPSPDALLTAMAEATVRSRGLLRAQTPEALRAIRAACSEAAKAYLTSEGIELPSPAVLASAAKP